MGFQSGTGPWAMISMLLLLGVLCSGLWMISTLTVTNTKVRNSEISIEAQRRAMRRPRIVWVLVMATCMAFIFTTPDLGPALLKYFFG